MRSMNLDTILQRNFGFSGFRSGQREIIEHITSGRDALVLMPTGGGIAGFVSLDRRPLPPDSIATT